MDATIPITAAAPKSSDPDGQPETGSSSLAAGSNAQRRRSRDKGESATMDEREAAELGRLKGRLMAEYGPSLGPDVVMRCIAEAIDHFHEAPVRTYVMLLVERRAITQLRHEASRTAADPGLGQDRPS